MNIVPSFPEHGRHDPKRRSKAIVNDQLALSEQAGHAPDELKVDPEASEPGFRIGINDVARFEIQVKGGQYTLERGLWRLHTGDSEDAVPCPLKQT